MSFMSLFIASTLLVLSLVACNKSSDNNSGVAAPPVAVTTNPNCANPQVYDPNCTGYNQYNQFGFQAYGANSFYGNRGYCNCQPGFRPVWGQIGMGCVQIDQIRPFAGVYLYAGNAPNNYQTVNINQISNYTGYPQSQSANCFDSVAYSCLIDRANYCGQGRLCRPTAPGSRMGICVAQ